MKRFTSLLLLLTALLSASCNRTPKPLDPASAEAVRVQLNILRDTVAASWSEMLASDDAKLRDTRQLLRELTAQPGPDRAQLAQLQYANDRLPGRRYNQLTMAESARIDAYDAAQDSLLQVVYRLALPADREPSPMVKELTARIQAADADLIAYRVHYDQAVTRFNDYLVEHASELQQLGGAYATLEPLPRFTIGK
ncbi:hypothetical protein KLP40_11535 [Hymenobacter sp. NST-14]|uniref:hypothetical protein n=1 Tax=Hymenobacter piscis TaxID=2839984 RepID=UPI001C02AAB8|nr:hypothetical protein [Hymenobacter piscis]MBT9393795.1 hypothetical protein [Hymenobacter piscis]